MKEVKVYEKTPPRDLYVPSNLAYVGVGGTLPDIPGDEFPYFACTDGVSNWAGKMTGGCSAYLYALPRNHPALVPRSEQKPEIEPKPHPDIHETAIIQSYPGSRTKVWAFSHIREDAQVGEDCTIGERVHIDKGVVIGNKCKIGNGSNIYSYAKIGNGVFIGPSVDIINDKNPKAVGKDGELLKEGEWERKSVTIHDGASIGAKSIIMPGVTIGKNAVIGAGSVVTKDVPSWGKWIGNSLVKEKKEESPPECEDMIWEEVLPSHLPVLPSNLAYVGRGPHHASSLPFYSCGDGDVSLTYWSPGYNGQSDDHYYALPKDHPRLKRLPQKEEFDISDERVENLSSCFFHFLKDKDNRKQELEKIVSLAQEILNH